jgi:hypothetical protein
VVGLSAEVKAEAAKASLNNWMGELEILKAALINKIPVGSKAAGALSSFTEMEKFISPNFESWR